MSAVKILLVSVSELSSKKRNILIKKIHCDEREMEVMYREAIESSFLSLVFQKSEKNRSVRG
jgi:hypothetical protein